MMPSLFEEKTGKFTGLTSEQLVTLKPDQLKAHDDVRDAAAALDAANAEFVAARDHQYESVRVLREAEAAALKERKWSHMDEWRSMVAAGRGEPDDRTLLKQAMFRCQAAGDELTPQNIRKHGGPVIEIDDGNPTLYDLQETLSEATVRYRVADERIREARGRLSQTITQWQLACGETKSFEQLARQHIASENAERARRVAEGRSRMNGQPGPSAIDHFAFATKQSGRRAGGSGSFRRGGMTYSEAARENARRAREKLPSER